MNTLNAICYCAFACSIIALPFLLVNWARYMKAQPINTLVAVRSGFPTKSISFFLVSTLTTMIVASVMTTYARRYATNFIQGLSENYAVYLNGQQVPEPGEMISALKEMTHYWGHHSHPTKRIRIDIRSAQKSLTLELARDSDEPQEYWVFSPEHGVTSNNEIGRITTSAFDGY